MNPTPNTPPLTVRRKLPLRKRLLFLAAALSIACLMLAIAGEVGLRCFTKVGTRMFHQGRYIPGFTGEVYNSESHRPVYVRINREGFRDVDHPLEKSDGVSRIAVIGDSFVADMAVDEKEGFVQQVRQSLTEQAGNKIEVLNFGISGCDLADYLQHYRHFAAKYKPDLVVVSFFHFNDFTGRWPELADDAIEHPYEQYAQPDFTGAKGFLLRHSVLYNWHESTSRVARDVLRDWLVQKSPDAYYRSMKKRFDRKWNDYRIFTYPPDDDCSKTWNVIEAQLAAFKRETNRANSKLLLVGIPAAEQATDEAWDSFSKEGAKSEGQGWSRSGPDKMLLSIARRLQIPYCPLLPALAKSDQPCYFGRGHLNEHGDRIAGQVVAERIRSENLLPVLTASKRASKTDVR